MPTADASPPRHLLRAVALRAVGRVFGTQRRLAELQLASVRVMERQVIAGFELYRVGLEAGLRFTEVATEAVSNALGAPAPAGSAPSGPT